MKEGKPGPNPSNRYIRVALWLVQSASRLVPWNRREEWRRVWVGELWHRARILEREHGMDRRTGIDLVRRSLGAFSHAAFLAFTAWRLPFAGRDFAHGLRRLRSRPGFTVVALVTLALGIGANTFLFGLAAWAKL